MNTRGFGRALAVVLAAGLMGTGPGTARATTITVVNADAAGEGFNDPTPATPVGGNPGTTIGAQRLYVFQFAANIWAGILSSTVEIRVHANFDPLFCTTNSAVLGQGGPATMWRDFAGAPLAGHWYHAALANRYAGSDLSGGDDVNITFNSSLGASNCMPAGWYYGVDGNEGSQIELLPVVLHELAHGLGFSTATDGSTGNYASGYPTVYDHYLLDVGTGKHWDEMSATERAASAVACRRLVWDGTSVKQHAPPTLNDRSLLRVNAPAGIAGEYDVGVAAFGPALGTGGVSASVVMANDAVGSPTNGCEAFTNAAAMAGKIALIDRGSCSFSTKVKNAQNAGAIAAIIADSLPGCPPGDMAGSDPTITIPSVRVTIDDGNTLKSALAAGLNVTLMRNAAENQGADNVDLVKLYTPTTYSAGSSVSHWDTSARPDLLMEPALMPSLSSGVDLTRDFFDDLGWNGAASGVSPGGNPPAPSFALAGVPNPMRALGLVRFWLPQAERVTLEVVDLHGRPVAKLLSDEPRASGLQQLAYDPGRLANGIYFLRLRAGAGEASEKITIVRQ